jgi:hypothetical protein
MKLCVTLLIILSTAYRSFSVPSWIVLEEIHLCGAKHPEICLAQYLWETGHGTSYAFRKYNNTHGWTNRNGLMKFKTWRHSIRHLLVFQKKYKGRTDEDYYNYLRNRWRQECDTEEYIQKIKSLHRIIKKQTYVVKRKL